MQAAAAIVPMSSRQEDLWDAAPAGGLVITSRVAIVLLYRHIDPQLRDEGAELLLDTAANALNGQNLAGLTFPQTTRIIQWDWQPPTVAGTADQRDVFLPVHRRGLGRIRHHPVRGSDHERNKSTNQLDRGRVRFDDRSPASRTPASARAAA